VKTKTHAVSVRITSTLGARTDLADDDGASRLLTVDSRTGVTRVIADPWRVMLVLLVVGLVASVSLAEIMMAVLGAALIRERLLGRLAVAWPLAPPIAAFALWTLIAALGSTEPGNSLPAARGVIELAALWVVLHAVGDAVRARWFATMLFGALVVVAALSILQVGTCEGERLYGRPTGLPHVVASFFGKCARAHGFFSIYMTLGGVLAIVLTLTLPRLTEVRHRTAAVVGWLVGAVAFALTFVRGAWVGSGAGVIVLMLSLRRQAALAISVLVMATALLAMPVVRHRAMTVFDMTDPTARERFAMWSAGLTLVRERPVMGIGPGQVKRVYPDYAPPFAVRRHTSHLHNTPLQIAVERGLIGLGLWLWIFVAFFARSVSIWRRLPVDAVADRGLVAGCVAGITAFLVGGLFEYNFGDTEVLLVAISVMALPFVIERTAAAASAA
jgi:O-antigen ligase